MNVSRNWAMWAELYATLAAAAIVDSADAESLCFGQWLLNFPREEAEPSDLPDMRDVPVLVSGCKSLNEQMKLTGGRYLVGSS